MTEKVGVAVWGVGRHARRNTIPALAACPAVRLVGLTTRSREILRQEAERWRCRLWESPEEMLSCDEVEVVYLATPTGLHYANGLAVLNAGRHLWCEKPLADTLIRAEEVVSTARDRDLAACEALMYVHHPQFKKVLEWLADGGIGELRSISGRFGFPHLDFSDFLYSRDLGGGALLDAGIYPLSAALVIAGEAPVSVKSCLSSEDGQAVDTGGSALLEFSTGVLALLEWGFGRSYLNELLLWGEHGSIHVDRAFSKPVTHSAKLRLERRDGPIIEKEVAPVDHFIEMFGSFARAVRDPDLRSRYLEEALARAHVLSAVRRGSEA